MEEISDSWEQYERADLTSDLARGDDSETSDLWEALSLAELPPDDHGRPRDAQAELFWQVNADNDGNDYCEHDGFSANWQHDRLIPAITEALHRYFSATGRCATVGCRSAATETITWQDSGQPVTEQVCTPCAQSYARRPALQVTRGS
jgi:hypothetical protein